MLIEKKEVGVNDIACVRLVTGEELIGKVVEINSNALVVSRPVLLQMQMISQSQAGIGFAPFMVAADEDAKFAIPNDKMLVLPMKARKDVAGNYIQATTGLQVPGSGGIIK